MLAKYILPKTILLTIAAASLTGCLVSGSRAQGPAMVETGSVEAGDQCPYGGLRIESGNDADGNGSLDGEEVKSISYACNARVDGYTTLVDTSTTIPQGSCPQGGLLISTGKDTNENGSLDSNEIEDTEVICDGDRGAAGRDGTDGFDGQNGADGADGADGEDGFNTLVNMSEVAPDPNGVCYFGGTRIDTGLDLDRDGNLSEAEIEYTRHVCSVHTNDQLTLVDHTLENPGANCEHGGIKVTVGYDDDGDKALSTNEIDFTGYVCNEIVLVSGKNSLVETTPATVAQCPAGGYMMRTGLDEDYDGTLGAGEVESQALVCNGSDGSHALVETSDYNGSQCGVDTLGYELIAGRDLDKDGKLDPNEVEHSEIICEGQDGILGGDGVDGANSLIRTSGDNGVCPYGGFRFDAGLDQNNDGVLSPGEITTTEYVCDGYDGVNSLVELGPHDGVCVYDGFRVDVGLDANNDGILNLSEISNTAYVCDGHDGYDSLVEVTVDPIDCPFTGLRFDVGLDLNRDNFLDFSEVQNTTIICD